MKVLCVAQQVASSIAFQKKIIPELKRRGHEVREFIANGKDGVLVAEITAEAARTTDIVLLGMSPSPELSREERAAGEAALKVGVPIALFSDTYIPHRAWFADLEKNCVCAFFVDADVAEHAKIAYPTAERVASGNPIWEDFYFPTVTREEVRKKLAVADDETMILVPGGKELPINMALLTETVNAAMLPPMSKSKPKVFYAIHPGELKSEEDSKIVLGAYRRFEKASYISVPVYIKTPADMPTAHMLVGADIVVESMATAGIEAAHIRIPVIEYFTEMGLARLEAMAGSRVWEPYQLGVVDAVSSADVLAAKMNYLLTSSGFSKLRKMQERRYPKPPECGTAARIIVDALEKHAKK